MNASPLLLEANAISKRFGATQALDLVDFSLRHGEVHALLGENGAGKSTLVKILAGTEVADTGELRIDGVEIEEYSPAHAAARGLFVVHQELSLVDVLSVAENVFLNRFPYLVGSFGEQLGIIDRRKLRALARASMRIMNYDVDVDSRVQTLDQAGKQVVEICRALAGAARIILLDEPTSSLTPDDRARLYQRIKALAASGVAVVIITHNIEEALSVADRITVLRDGRRVITLDRAEARVERIIEHMSGVATGQVFPTRTEIRGRVSRLVIDHLAAAPRIFDVSLDVGVGEIVGLAGLVGAGRTEVMKSLFGLLTHSGGTMMLDGQLVSFRAPAAAMRAGLFMISEDRQGEGIIPTAPILHNIALSSIIVRGTEDGIAPFGMLQWSRIRRICDDIANTIRIKAASLDASILSLSGGNQQKVILGRCLMSRPRLILADEPTRGVSIGSKIEIYKVLRELAESGVSILLASSEFDELVGLCNRIYLIDRGRTVGEVTNSGLTSHELLNLVLSASAQKPVAA